MVQEPKKKPKMSDKERHERFKEMAREVDASEDAEVFDKAFKSVTTQNAHGR